MSEIAPKTELNMKTIVERIGIQARAEGEPKITQKQARLLHSLGIENYNKINELGIDQASAAIDRLKQAKDSADKFGSRILMCGFFIIIAVVLFQWSAAAAAFMLLIGAANVGLGYWGRYEYQQYVEVLNDTDS